MNAMTDRKTGPLSLLTAPFESRTWAETLHLLLDLPVGVFTFSFFATMLSTGIGTAVTVVGLPVLAATVLAGRGIAGMERRRARTLLGVDIGPPPAPRWRHGQGFGAWLRAGMTDATGWRAVLYGVLLLPVGALGFSVVMAFWSSALGGITYPIWYRWLPMDDGHRGTRLWPHFYPSEHLAVTFGMGVVLLFVTPWIVRGLAYLPRALTGLLQPVGHGTPVGGRGELVAGTATRL
ncbi:MAG: sensor domain-containing protein [Mycobacteriales bacterium]